MIYVGLGLRPQAVASDILELVAPLQSRALTFCVRTKHQDHLALQDVVRSLDAAVKTFADGDLAGQQVITQSSRILARFGTGSVAEALAQLGAGRGSAIVRLVSKNGQVTASWIEL